MLDSVASKAIAREESVLVIDPKGERDCRDSLKRRCEAVGQPERFTMLDPSDPADSIRISPLSHYTRATELAIRIAGLSASAQVEDDPLTCFATLVLTSIINGMLLVGETPTLVAVNRAMTHHGAQALLERALVTWCRRYVANWPARAGAYIGNAAPGKATVDALVRFYREQAGEQARCPELDHLLSVFEHDPEHMRKMTAPLMSVLASLTDADIGPLLSPDPHDGGEIGDLARLIDNAGVFYIRIDTPSEPTTGAAIAALMLADLTALVRQRRDASLPDTPINVLVDPATVNPAMMRSLDKARGAGIRVRFDA